MLNIVIPMAGRGSRFRDVGFTLPKPLIPVHGKPMIQLVVQNLRPSQPHRFIFVCLQEHLDAYDLAARLRHWAPGCEVIALNAVTEGAACTVLTTREFIDNDDALMIANSDQWVDVSIDDYLGGMKRGGYDGYIMTMWADDPKWSFVRFDAKGDPCEVVEKQVVSHEATVGIYNFRRGADYVSAADSMIRKDLRVNNEFYVAPVYNELLAAGKRVGLWNVGREAAGMYGLGVPADLDKFLQRPISQRATAF